MTTGKNLALTRPTFISKVMSLLFNMLSSLVITFLPWSERLFISFRLFISTSFYFMQSPSVVILEPKKIKSVTISIVSPSICHEVMGPDALILVFWMNTVCYLPIEFGLLLWKNYIVFEIKMTFQMVKSGNKKWQTTNGQYSASVFLRSLCLIYC